MKGQETNADECKRVGGGDELPAQVQGRRNAEDIVQYFKQLKTVNCHHYPITFIPGFSTQRGEPQDPKENAKTYEESQEQRGLERKLRQERRDLAVMKAQGADSEAIKQQKARVDAASDAIDEFCDRTGRSRKRNREYTPIDAKFPPKNSYDPADFPTDVKDQMEAWFRR